MRDDMVLDIKEIDDNDLDLDYHALVDAPAIPAASPIIQQIVNYDEVKQRPEIPFFNPDSKDERRLAALVKLKYLLSAPRYIAYGKPEKELWNHVLSFLNTESILEFSFVNKENFNFTKEYLQFGKTLFISREMIELASRVMCKRRLPLVGYNRMAPVSSYCYGGPESYDSIGKFFLCMVMAFFIAGLVCMVKDKKDIGNGLEIGAGISLGVFLTMYCVLPFVSPCVNFGRRKLAEHKVEAFSRPYLELGSSMGAWLSDTQAKSVSKSTPSEIKPLTLE